VESSSIQIGSFAIHWYGILVAIGFMAGLWTASRRGPLYGIPGEKILDIGPWIIVGSILGARALYVFTFWREEFAGQPFVNVLMVWRGGLVFYGGLIGACVATILFTWLKKIPLWRLADALAPSIPLGYVFGRIGCLMNGCCYGRPCSLPWAIRFPPGHETHPVGSPAVPVHPTQIYDSLLSLGLYLGLAWLYRRKRFDGQVFSTYLVAYACLRSFVEVFRGDYPENQRVLSGALTPAHLVSILILAAGATLFLILKKRQSAPA
jgi:phosphatidylglycerol---prolipoprotein diacylglyceryl transferase